MTVPNKVEALKKMWSLFGGAEDADVSGAYVDAAAGLEAHGGESLLRYFGGQTLAVVRSQFDSYLWTG